MIDLVKLIEQANDLSVRAHREAQRELAVRILRALDASDDDAAARATVRQICECVTERALS